MSEGNSFQQAAAIWAAAQEKHRADRRGGVGLGATLLAFATVVALTAVASFALAVAGGVAVLGALNLPTFEKVR